ncbi:hypothetical protein [Pseudomonas viridiflava]|uniref:DUF7657 domain-containing protein n=1 Tax=Pseudomonas viridiflava TaxID=33069 RepID=UPI002EA97F71|nr:hypothetical protein [Pseudomonas viridiflava]
MIKFIILTALLGAAISFVRTAWITRTVSARLKIGMSEPTAFSLCVVLVFLLFTALGLTGSSLNLGLRNTPFVDADMTRIWGHERPIRSDEWLVLTPMAIAQHNHTPRHPVLNTSLGLDGQNMLVVGMAGVPVAHVSTLAKPATWGFFVFDLKRALAWYWWFPTFGCFLALAHLLNALAPGRWRQGFLFALLFVAAPYAVAWSFWPAYAVFFPCVALLCLLKILSARSTWLLLPLGVLAGLALAGFVLLLYPPWQVSVGYVFIALLAGLVWRDRLYRGIRLEHLLAILLAVLIAGIVLISWWLSAQDAIHAMMRTVYPGQRHIEVGGNVPWHMTLKGYTNLTALAYTENSTVNQSEIASFYYYLLPLATLFLLRARQRALDASDIALTIIMSLILIYMLIGFGPTLSTYSLWSYVPPNRADLAFGLASLILTHLLIRPARQDVIRSESPTFIAWAVALIWATLVYDALKAFEGPVMAGSSSSITLGLMLLVIASGYFLLTRQTRAFLIVNLGLTLATTLSFHPVFVAPHWFRNSLPYQDSPALTLSTRIPMMFLFASGQKVVNGVFYYPQDSLWKRLDPENRHVQLHNRYQHLMFINQPLATGLEITVPHPDMVTVLINFQTQDFNRTGASLVLAPDSDKPQLSLNPTLSLQHSEKGWSLFRVHAAP